MNQETSDREWMKHSSLLIPDKMDPATASTRAQPFARLLAGRRPEEGFRRPLKRSPDVNSCRDLRCERVWGSGFGGAGGMWFKFGEDEPAGGCLQRATDGDGDGLTDEVGGVINDQHGAIG